MVTVAAATASALQFRKGGGRERVSTPQARRFVTCGCATSSFQVDRNKLSVGGLANASKGTHTRPDLSSKMRPKHTLTRMSLHVSGSGSRGGGNRMQDCPTLPATYDDSSVANCRFSVMAPKVPADMNGWLEYCSDDWNETARPQQHGAPAVTTHADLWNS